MEIGSDNTADDADVYNPVPGAMGLGAGRQTVPSACSTLDASPDKDDTLTATPVQSSISAAASKPSPPTAHCVPAHSAHYKSPGPAIDGVSSALVIKPRPDLPPKTAAVPAIPPRKPRPPAVNPAPDRSDALPLKATQPQPPLPHITPAIRKSAGTASVFNKTYDISLSENTPQAVSKPCSVEANGSTPPVPVPRNIAAVNSAQSQASASSNPMTVSSDSPVLCDDSDEQVSKRSF